MGKFYSLKVINTKQETNDSVSVSFDIPYELYDTFNYKPGQFVTLKFNIDGTEARRSYSLCSTPALEEPLTIGVKRVKNGLVSNYINNSIKVGSTIEVMPPEGRFFADIKKENYKTYYLFAAGSGITPILSILKTVLLTEKQSFVHMIYGNSNQDTVMFKNELDKLQKEYPQRLILVHSLSKPKSSWFSSKSNIEYRKGRVDEEAVNWFINEYPPYAQNTEYYICGPGTMIQNTKKALKGIDVPEERIFIENFLGPQLESNIDGVENAELVAELNGEIITTIIKKEKTILRALIDDGRQPPYSCEGGVCSTCICKLKKGEVHMVNNLALSDKEIKEGYILSCQSIPLSEHLEVIYE